MANGMALILKTPVEELVPKLMEWNNEELLTAVETRLANYRGIVYDDTQISSAKADRAQLNAFCKALNDERIRVGKVYSAPYDKFKSEVDEVVNKVKTVVDEIDTQVKVFETKKQAQKLADIKAYYQAIFGEFAELIPYDRIHSVKWLNSSVSMKSVMAEIDSIYENANNALIAIKALKTEDEDAIKAYYFRTLDLSAALTESERLKAEKRKIIEVTAKQVDTVIESAGVNVETAEAKLQTVRFQVEGTIEQLRELQRYLRENNIKYSAI